MKKLKGSSILMVSLILGKNQVTSCLKKTLTSLACICSETHNLQAMLFSSYLVHKTTAVAESSIRSRDSGNWE